MKMRRKKKRNENIKKPMHPFTKKVMSRMPRRPVLSSHILQCHCAQSHCIQEGSNNGSNCPIECFNKETLQRYAFEDGRCTCPYCACTCSKAYKVADIPKIVLKLAKVEHVKKEKIPPEVVTRNFIFNVMGAATQSAIQLKHNTYDGGKRGVTEEQVNEVVTSAFYDTAAENLLRKSIALPTESRMQMAKAFGTNTDVILPSGAKFDTNQIKSNTGFHITNNSLAYTSKGNEVHSKQITGMVDRLNPDYSNTTDEYRSATLKPCIAESLFSPTNTYVSISSGSTGGKGSTNQKPIDLSDDSSDNDIKQPALLPEFGTPRSEVWERMERRNLESLQMNKTSAELDANELKEKKRAKRIAAHMRANPHPQTIAGNILSLSHDHNSPAYIKCYENAFMDSPPDEK